MSGKYFVLTNCTWLFFSVNVIKVKGHHFKQSEAHSKHLIRHFFPSTNYLINSALIKDAFSIPH